MRRYRFAKNPALPKGMIPARQDIFNQHARQIQLSAWAEGLRVREDMFPQVTFTNTGYDILVFLEQKQATPGFHDVKKFKTLQEILPSKKA